MTGNPLLDHLRSGEVALGCFCAVPSVITAEQVAGTGVQYVGVDLQHGAIGYSDAMSMFLAIQAAGAMPMARVTANDPAEIGKILDAGALGVIVPLVDNAEEAERAVAACRYPPRGRRSFGPIRAATAVGSRRTADLEAVACFLMVETVEGLGNVDEIAAVPGVDGLYIGPADLSLALGIEPAYEHNDDSHREAVRRIREACGRHGLVAAVHCDGGDCGGRRIAEGFRMITLGTEVVHARRRIEDEVARARQAEPRGAASAG